MIDNLKLFCSVFFWLLLTMMGLAVIFTLPLAIIIKALQQVIA